MNRVPVPLRAGSPAPSAVSAPEGFTTNPSWRCDANPVLPLAAAQCCARHEDQATSSGAAQMGGSEDSDFNPGPGDNGSDSDEEVRPAKVRRAGRQQLRPSTIQQQPRGASARPGLPHGPACASPAAVHRSSAPAAPPAAPSRPSTDRAQPPVLLLLRRPSAARARPQAAGRGRVQAPQGAEAAGGAGQPAQPD